MAIEKERKSSFRERSERNLMKKQRESEREKERENDVLLEQKKERERQTSTKVAKVLSRKTGERKIKIER